MGEAEALVVDGRTDKDKVLELLRAGEQTRLDYKASLDLTVNEDKLNFVKDIVAMSNRPGGGYILIGVDDAGQPCAGIGELDLSRFDGARLGEMVRSYIDGQIHVHTQSHDLPGGEQVVVVRVEGHRDGLPVPMAKDGQYQGSKGTRSVFRKGDVAVREGAANVPLRHAHWGDLLAQRDASIRMQAMNDAQQLIGQFVELMRAGGAHQGVPMTLDMDNDTFAAAVESNFSVGDDAGVRRMLTRAGQPAQSRKDNGTSAMDKVTIIAIQSILAGSDETLDMAIGALFKIYMDAHHRRAPVAFLVEIITRVYAIGALAVRTAYWSGLPGLVLRPVNIAPVGDYRYASWIRHGQVQGSRSNLFNEQPLESAMVLSAAKAFCARQRWARPDVDDSDVVPADQLQEVDEILDSLCQFDALYCLLVSAEGSGDAGAYPSCAAFDQSRSDPIFEVIAREAEIRRTLFKASTDSQVATAMHKVFEQAIDQSAKFGHWWFGPTGEARFFIELNRKDAS